MRILVAYRAIPHSPGWATGDSLVRAFRRLGHTVWPHAKVYGQDAWLPAPKDFAPDLLVYLECNDLDPQYVDLLDIPCPRVYWEFDTTMHREWSEQWCNLGWNAVFLANKTQNHGALKGAIYLPYAVDDEKFTPKNKGRRGAACIGHPFPERVEFCERAGIDLVHGVYNDAYAQALAGLAVSVHHHDSGGDGLLVGRIWESLGAGCCLLTQDSPSIREHFRVGFDLMTYTDADDCRDRATKLLERPVQRMRIAAQGHSTVMRKHTYLNRARAILAALS